MRRYLMLFNVLANVISHESFRNKDDVTVYLDAYNGDTKAIAKLKDLGCDNEMPIHCAAQQGNAEAITTLTTAGANVNTPTNNDRTYWFFGQTERIGTKNGRTPVFIAAQNGHAETITALYALGANMDTADKNGITPTYIAAQNGHAKAIAALKNAGANVNMPEINFGTTPVYIAAAKGHAAAITALLNAGADASIGRSRQGWGLLDAIGNLVDTASDLTPWGRHTPLKIARQGKKAEHQEVVRLLEMHFQQYPNGIKLAENRSSPILTQFHLSKPIPEDNAESAAAPNKKTSNFREF